MLLESATGITTFAGSPSAHWKKNWSTNPLERLNWEIKRRADVVQVFPNRRPWTGSPPSSWLNSPTNARL